MEKAKLVAALRKILQQLAHSCELIEEGPLPTDEIQELAALIATLEREPEPEVLAELTDEESAKVVWHWCRRNRAPIMQFVNMVLAQWGPLQAAPEREEGE
jgi:hypothetical protein